MLSVRKLAVGVVAAAVAVVGVSLVTGSDDTVQAVSICSSSATDLGGGGEYHPITPFRVYDSRSGGGAAHVAGQPVSINITGLPGMPKYTDDNKDGIDDNVLAVWANVTTTQQNAKGWLKATPNGTPFGSSSITNFDAGKASPNSSMLRPGNDGKVDLVVGPAARAHIVVDIFGYFSSCNDARGARVKPVGPARLLDTRTNGSTLTGGTSLELQIRGADSITPAIADIVPNDPNVTAVVVNLTGVNPKNGLGTYVTASPDAPAPGAGAKTSNLNLQPGLTRANLAIVPIADDGKIRIYNNLGRTDVIVDVVGYMLEGEAAATSAGRVVPLASHYRAVDTREKFSGGPKKLGPGAAEVWSFEKMINSVKVGGQSVGAQSGMFANFTGTNITRTYPDLPVGTTFMSIYPPALTGTPTFSNLNLGENESVPNMSLVSYGADPSVTVGSTQLCAAAHCAKVFNRSGFAHYVFDVQAVILK